MLITCIMYISAFLFSYVRYRYPVIWNHRMIFNCQRVIVGKQLFSPMTFSIAWVPFKKQRHFFADKGLYSQAMVFPVVTYGCESWTVKKAEHRRIDAFELWSWRRLLTVPWTARRSNQSILKEISPKYSLVRLVLKLRLQYFGHLIWRIDWLERPWCWERLRAGGEGDDRGWDGWMASLTW